MNDRFRDQGGAASSNPSWLRRFLTSQMMRRLADPERRERARARVEAQRLARGEPHRVEYFHQLDDPYSALAAQTLASLAQAYDIELVPQLVAADRGPNTPEPQMLADYARRDAALVAPHYGLDFPAGAAAPRAESVALGERILAAAPARDFARLACAVGAALWYADDARLAALAEQNACASAEQAAQQRAVGSARRRALGHYSGAMFHYGGEWYWGVDRLYHLERRLAALGAQRTPGTPLVAPRPAIELPPGCDGTGLVLETFASLRSPYTSIIYYRALELARRAGVRFELRAVLPMVMRGVPATREKGAYIFFDTAREAEALGLRWGHAWDPIGDPVRRVYSLLPWARSRGRAEALLGAALQAAFFNGLDVGSERGLRFTLTAAGLPWQEAKPKIGRPGWEAECERNRVAMYEAGLWGVPAFRLLDAQGDERLAVWGQDRLWLVAREITRLSTG
jgi:2-hydroxychromene-2-carboxylate isomerase